jgi:hypothetical protein
MYQPELADQTLSAPNTYDVEPGELVWIEDGLASLSLSQKPQRKLLKSLK